MTEDTKSPGGQVADADKGNWVDTSAPDWTRPYLRLTRADRPAPMFLLYIPCIWSILLAATYHGDFGLWDIWLIIGCGIGAFLMRGAGCTWNDITDRDFDAQVERTKSRPIPSGQVSVTQALIWLGLQCLISFLILISFGLPAIIVGVTSLIFVAIYPFAKRFTWWPQIFLGLAFNWGALLGWTAHSGALEWPAFVLYAAGIVWTLFYDTIYAHQDTEDDALIGVKSTARLFGENSPRWLWTFIGVSGALFLLAGLTSQAGFWAWAAAAGFVGHMVWQMTRLDIHNPPVLLALFRSNRDAGLIATMFLLIGAIL